MIISVALVIVRNCALGGSIFGAGICLYHEAPLKHIQAYEVPFLYLFVHVFCCLLNKNDISITNMPHAGSLLYNTCSIEYTTCYRVTFDIFN